MLEEEIQLLILCLREYIETIDDKQFKEVFLGYVEYMARNYCQDCFIDEYNQMMIRVERFMNNHGLDIKSLPPYKHDLLCRWVSDRYNEQDILALYYFNGSSSALELFIDSVETKSML